MAQFSPQTDPAIRTVDGNGNVQRGPHYIGAIGGKGAANGWNLTATRVSYTPELQGPIKKATWEEAPILNGFRLEVDLEFGLIVCNTILNASTYGLGLLQAYMNDAMLQSTYAPFQFNLFFGQNVSSVWRGFYPSTPFAPQPAEGKDGAGYALKISLKARELVPTMAGIDWAGYRW
jgi:hypothetical protein